MNSRKTTRKIQTNSYLQLPMALAQLKRKNIKFNFVLKKFFFFLKKKKIII